METLNMDEAQLASEWCHVCGKETLFLQPSRNANYEPLHGISEGWIVNYHCIDSSPSYHYFHRVYCPEHAEAS